MGFQSFAWVQKPDPHKPLRNSVNLVHRTEIKKQLYKSKRKESVKLIRKICAWEVGMGLFHTWVEKARRKIWQSESGSILIPFYLRWLSLWNCIFVNYQASISPEVDRIFTGSACWYRISFPHTALPTPRRLLFCLWPSICRDFRCHSSVNSWSTLIFTYIRQRFPLVPSLSVLDDICWSFTRIF